MKEEDVSENEMEMRKVAQYCRYCQFLVVEQGGYYCPLTDRYISTKSAKHTNTCSQYKLNPIDAMRMNQKGYKPTGLKPIELGGLGKQIKMDEVLKGAKNGQK